jgi:hypothetical protein
MPECKTPECLNRSRSNGLCVNHASRLYRAQRRLRPIVNPCTFPDCGRPVSSRGLCDGHAQQRRSGRELRRIEVRYPRSGHCIIFGCEALVHARGMCSNHAKLKSTYNLSDRRAVELLTDPKCAICGSRESGVLSRQLFVDHDHSHHENPKTACDECVRGLLCHRCNSGIGMFLEDPKRLAAALVYLEGHISSRTW